MRFFEENTTTVGNVKEKYISKYRSKNNSPQTCGKIPQKIQAKLTAAYAWAEYVLQWSREDRKQYFQNP